MSTTGPAAPACRNPEPRRYCTCEALAGLPVAPRNPCAEAA